MEERAPRVVNAIAVLLGLWLCAYGLDNTLLPGLAKTLSPLFDRGTDLVVAGAGLALCVARVVRVREERLAWGLLSAGLGAWLAGDLVYTLRYELADEVPFPSVCDAGYLLFPPLAGLGLVGLWRSRTRGRVSRGLAIDAVTAALTAAAFSASLSWSAVLADLDGHVAAVVTNLAYPLSDLLLLAVLVAGLAARGWTFDRTFVWLTAAVVAFWLADSGYLVAVSQGTYAVGAWFDALWYLAFVLFGLAAWQPAHAAATRSDRLRNIVMPIGFAAAALALLVLDHFAAIDLLALALVVLALASVLVRVVVLFAENTEMLRHSRREALTDALTGLGNRRSLVRALEAGAARADDAHPLTLVLYDLDGFKHYNDTFGHPAGDALLQRLGHNLSCCAEGRAGAFRMGGDEFCLLIDGSVAEGQRLAAEGEAALSDRGDGFAIGASHGRAVLPRDADLPSDALRVADQRLYAVKNGRRSSAGRQSTDVLLRVLAERHPDLADHTRGVADRAVATGLRLGLSPEECEFVRQAAELHDIGKIAIPDAILLKRGPLDEPEWAFIRQHTVIGQRIIAAAPALERVALIVRASHERWDGDGYPDRLAAHDIPLGARIVAVCDAYDAMTQRRPYSAPRPPGEALQELRRCAGTQFDPAVVEAFCGCADPTAMAAGASLRRLAAAAAVRC